MDKKPIIFLLLLTALLSGCLSYQATEPDYKTIPVTIDGRITVSAEVAETPAETTRGLMHREHLDMDKGMIFIFKVERERNFWMKNTLIPLDIIFIDSNKTIVKIHEAYPCKVEECPRYPSALPIKYVLEVNQGFSENNNISVGDKVSIPIA